MSHKTIGEGLKTRLLTIKGLRVYAPDELPDSVSQFPAALILPGETPYVTTLNSLDCDYNFRIILLFSQADTPSAISKMLDYMAVSGDKSIVAAIHGDKTLDGSADTCKVSRNMGVGGTTWGGSIYLSTEFQVQVWA